ncbi:MAG: S-layer homology domain-containing protein [Butyricicoccus sp.]|nr:S-layer homology domain-containing protein [Butyricicoccus sp.]
MVTARCSDGNCPAPAGGSLTLVPPAHKVCGDGLEEHAVLTGELPGLEGSPRIEYDQREADGGYTPLEAAPTGAGSYRAGISIPVDGSDLTGVASVEYVIAPAGLTVSGTGVAHGTYGDTLSMLSISGLTVHLGETEIAGEWKLTGGTVPSVGDAGTYFAVFTPDENAENYQPLTAPVTLSIGTAVYNGSHDSAATTVLPGMQTDFNLAAHYTALPAGCVFGAPTVEGDILSGAPQRSGSVLTFTAADAAEEGASARITVPVSCAGYADFRLALTVTVSAKQAQESFGFPVSAHKAAYGGANFVLAAAGAAAGSTVTYASSDPAVARIDPASGMVEITGAGSAVITASVPGTAAYLPKEVSYTLTVAPRPLLITAEDQNVTVGDALPTLTYTTDGLVNGDMLRTAPTLGTEGDPAAAGAYVITVSGADAGPNYSISYQNGTLTVGEAPVIELEPETIYLQIDVADALIDCAVVVRDADGDPLRLKQRRSGSSSFEVPEGGAEIEIELTLDEDALDALIAQRMAALQLPLAAEAALAAELPAPPFDDVDADDAHYEAVSYVYAKGLMGGNGSQFEPDESLSRAMAARMFYALEDCPMTGRTDFTDVPRGQWYTEAVDWAASVGVIAGSGDGSFDPHGPVSREQLAVMLYHYAVGKRYYVEISPAEAVPMAGVSPWAAKAVIWADACGILSAQNAASIATRADIAQAFLNFAERFN